MKTNTETVTRDDLMGITIAVLMFVLQGCMVVAMSTSHLDANELDTARPGLTAGPTDFVTPIPMA